LRPPQQAERIDFFLAKILRSAYSSEGFCASSWQPIPAINFLRHFDKYLGQILRGDELGVVIDQKLICQGLGLFEEAVLRLSLISVWRR
jgi:hypothetical protein